MKKILIALAMAGTMAASGTAFAASQAQTNTGCGLGALLIGEKGNESLIGQLAMTLLNNTVGTQTFGITSGTSECKQNARVVQNERLNEFVAANMDNLAKDIAAGRGESLETMAELMNIPAVERPAVYTKLQANFGSIFTSENVQAANVIDNMVTVING